MKPFSPTAQDADTQNPILSTPRAASQECHKTQEVAVGTILPDHLTFDGQWAMDLAGKFDVPAAAVRRRMLG